MIYCNDACLYPFSHTTGVQCNEIPDMLARDSSALWFLGPDPALGDSRQEGLEVGWLTRIGYGSEVLVTPIDRLES